MPTMIRSLLALSFLGITNAFAPSHHQSRAIVATKTILHAAPAKKVHVLQSEEDVTLVSMFLVIDTILSLGVYIICLFI